MNHNQTARREQRRQSPEPMLFDTDAEKWTLGAAFWSPETAAVVVEMLTADDFGDEMHREIFLAICRLHQRGESGDPALLLVELRSLPEPVATHFRENEWQFRIVELASAQYRIRHARRYAELVLAATSRRRLALTAERLQQGLAAGEDVAELVREAAALTGEIRVADRRPSGPTVRDLLNRRPAGVRR